MRRAQNRPFSYLEIPAAIDAIKVQAEQITASRNRFRPKEAWAFNRIDLEALERIKLLIAEMEVPEPEKPISLTNLPPRDPGPI